MSGWAGLLDPWSASCIGCCAIYVKGDITLGYTRALMFAIDRSRLKNLDGEVCYSYKVLLL